MKSAPELWELADDDRRQSVWLSMLLDQRDPVAVAVDEREPTRRIVWSSPDHEIGRLELEFTEGGLGTVVEARAQHAGATDNATLETMIDDLGTVERRPFSAA